MYLMPDLSSAVVLFIKGAIVILSLLKAFYIVGVFMHLGEEIKNLIMTIIVPLLLFVWFIAAFLWDGSSWRELRNTQGKSKSEQVVNSKGVQNKTPAAQH
jgi:cytochrome c oxidase subunit IV